MRTLSTQSPALKSTWDIVIVDFHAFSVARKSILDI